MRTLSATKHIISDQKNKQFVRYFNQYSSSNENRNPVFIREDNKQQETHSGIRFQC